ncbi:MAG: Trm112 family protein [Ignavibacteriales bacterium]|nr:Trm112 family protein [Ignavibacteriales bacterium]
MLPKELLDILCCPKCHGDLLYEPKLEKLTCKSCRKIYPIKNDIPIMLVDDNEQSGSKNERTTQQ